MKDSRYLRKIIIEPYKTIILRCLKMNAFTQKNYMTNYAMNISYVLCVPGN